MVVFGRVLKVLPVICGFVYIGSVVLLVILEVLNVSL